MLSLEREVAAAPISAAAKERIAAIERRAIVSLRQELRALLWLGVALISAGVGTLLARNIERIGHAALMIAIAVAAAACYAFAWRMRHRAGSPGAGAKADGTPPPHEGTASVAGEYLLLLGALLLSADLAYAEAQLKILGGAWRWHLAILAVVHGATAYAFASRKVLSLAIVALAGLFGVDRSGELFSRGSADAAARLAAAAASIAVWRIAHERVSRLDSFCFTLEQAAFHLAMIASITAIFDDTLSWIGLAAALVVAALGGVHAVGTREESFLVFSILYAVFAIDAAALPRIDDLRITMVWLVLTTPLAIVGLYLAHRRWKERFA